MNTVFLNKEDTVKVGDFIRPLYIPEVTSNFSVDRSWYYIHTYRVEGVRSDYPYPLPDGSEGVGTVAWITVNNEMEPPLRKKYREFYHPADRRYYITHFEIVQDPATADSSANPVIELTEHEQEIAKLKELNRVQAERIQTLLSDVGHNSDVLSRSFIDLKDRYNWCDTANEVAMEINGELRGGLEIECEQEFEIEMDVTATMRTTMTATVTASSREAAEAMVMDDPSSFIEEYQVNDALGWEGWADIEYELS